MSIITDLTDDKNDPIERTRLDAMSRLEAMSVDRDDAYCRHEARILAAAMMARLEQLISTPMTMADREAVEMRCKWYFQSLTALATPSDEIEG